MSRENAEIVRDAVVAFNRGDLDTWLDEYSADDIDYRAVEGALDDSGPMHDKDAVRAYLQDWIDTFDQFKVEPLEVIDAGQGQVVAVFRNSGRAKLSGVEADLTFAVVYKLSDGKIARAASIGPATKPSKPPGCRSRVGRPRFQPASRDMSGQCRTSSIRRPSLAIFLTRRTLAQIEPRPRI
jgi:ketosteroid isomerase-like protein